MQQHPCAQKLTEHIATLHNGAGGYIGLARKNKEGITVHVNPDLRMSAKLIKQFKDSIDMAQNLLEVSEKNIVLTDRPEFQNIISNATHAITYKATAVTVETGPRKTVSELLAYYGIQ